MLHDAWSGLLVRTSLLSAVVVGLLAMTAPSVVAVGPSRGGSPPPITAPTTTTYTVDGRSVTMACQGSGSVPVIFQAGGDDPGSRWDGLVAALGPKVLTCVFDRPGVAPSATSPTPLTPRKVSKTLAAVLKQAGIGRRVVLVGHSIGGLNALVFGAAYPKKVAGAVLFDPSEAAFFRATQSDAILESYGFEPAAVYQQIGAVKHWPSVPLRILSRDPDKAVAGGQSSAELEKIWEVGAESYARLSRKGSRTVVPGTTHYVDIDAPQAALDAINEVLAKAH